MTDTYSIRRVVFHDEAGLVTAFDIWHKSDQLTVYVERQGKAVVLAGNRLPIKVEAKIRRLVPKYDKIGSASVNL